MALKSKNKEEQKTTLRLSDKTTKPIYGIDPSWEKKEFRDVVEIMPIKAIIQNLPGQPIELANGYAKYLQIFSIEGKDIYALSEQEQKETVQSYISWLSGTVFPFTEQTTTLPTDTRSQVDELVRILNRVRLELEQPELSAQNRAQLNMRRNILIHNIIELEVVANQQYNTEFFIWIYGDSLEDLAHKTRQVTSLSVGFRPEIISLEKKEQVLTQYFNANEYI